VRNEEVLHRVNEVRNIMHAMKRTKGNSTGHILCKKSSKTRY
jgi:hypothetical protein